MKRNMTVRTLCLALVMALLLNLAACVDPAQPSSTASVPTTSAPTTAPSEPTVPPTEPTVPPTEPPTEPTEPPTEPTEPLVEPTFGPNVPVYELSQEDVDEFYRLLDECEKMAIAGEDLDAIDAISDALDEQFEYLQAQNSVAMIHYYSDMDNKLLSNRHLDCVDMLTEANDAYIKSVRRIYLSDTPAKDMLFEDWTDEDIQMLLNYDDRMVELQQRNAEIEVAYRAATSDDEIIPLYIELVQNNNEIAQLYGYENYYVYAYELVYERDYAPEEIQQMRDYAKTYLTSAFDTSLRNFNKSFGALKPAQQQAISNFLYNDYTTVATGYIEQYLEAMPGSLKEHYEQMISVDSLFATASGAMEGAFTTTVGDRSYCFFGPGYANATTVIHEAGHYYASRYTDLGSIPMDLAETHSQGNEWLFIASLSDNIGAAQYNSMVDYLMYNNMAMIMICLMVDEFEQRVYTTEDLSAFTADDFDAIMDSVCQQYFDLNYVSNNLTDVNAYWRLVVVEQPVYYISYAVSSIASLDLYTIAAKDFASAAEIYRKLCEEPLEEEGFVENITVAGLSGPFHEEFYQDIIAILQARAKALNKIRSAA